MRAADRIGTTSMAGATIVRAPTLVKELDQRRRLVRRPGDEDGAARERLRRARAHPTSTCARIRSAPWAISAFAASAAASSGVAPSVLTRRTRSPSGVAMIADQPDQVLVARWRRPRAGARSRRRAATSATARRPGRGGSPGRRAVRSDADRLLVVVTASARRGSPGRAPAPSPRAAAAGRGAGSSPSARARPRPAPAASTSPSASFAAACRRCRGGRPHRTAGTPPAAARAGAGSTCRSRAPCASSPGSRQIRTSPGSARSGTAAIMNPSSSSAGRSFAECTARSISPASRASRIVSIHRPLRPCGPDVAAAPSSPEVVIGHELGLDAVRREVGADLFGLGDRERRAARADPHGAHVASGSIPSSSARTRAWTPSVPGSERSFSSTIGSCSSFAAMPRASASTAARSSGVRSRGGMPGGRARPGRPRRRGGGAP